MPRILCLLLFAAFLSPSSGWPGYPRQTGGFSLSQAGPAPVIGQNEKLFVQQGDTLIRLARANGLGYRNLVNANPGIDPWLPPKGHLLVLPYASILPNRPQVGITVNLADQRLYLVREEDNELRIRVYPIGIGDAGRETPEGMFAVRERIAGPSWTVPEALRRENPELPGQVPPGPDNPLGAFWIGFSEEGYGIHGTNRPYGIGRRVSYGCIRLYPEDIRDLFRKVSPGTPVAIVYRPVKVGVRNDQLLVEAHPDFLGRVSDPYREVLRQAASLSWSWPLDPDALEQALAEKTGIPIPVSTATHGIISGGPK